MSEKPAYLRGRGRGRGSVGFGDGTVVGRGRGIGRTEYVQTKGQESVPVQKSAEERFNEASSKYQESIQRHLQDEEENGSVSSEDEEDIGDNVLQTVFKSYSNTDDSSIDDLNKAQESLLHSFRSGTSACLVCIETIKKTDPIWSCQGCYGIFHIQCIQKWVKDGVYQHVYKSEDEEIDKQAIPWHCPKCRTEYHQRECPTRYFCFCGKEEDPKFDPWLVPHSCGQTCGRPLKPECGHSCLLLCHPGACPPCPQTVKSPCYCGKAKPQVRRCSARTWSCGGHCGRLLACGQHYCQQSCHAGACAACPKTSTQPCLCGKQKAVRPCASPQWQCEQPCGRGLSCGNHVCEIVCHKGQCGPCPRGGSRKCPCGKTEVDLPCTEDIPTCGDTCGKMLACGLHACVQRCHTGPCGSCRQMTVKQCRCGQKKKEVLCYKEFLCETKCTNMRDCRKHQCKRKCCDGNCPTCEQVCGKPLGCKNHKCSSRCHRGPCYPCPETVEITCFCKWTKITVPCGREKITKPPRCNQACKIPPICHHPSRLKHRCHFGDCPFCRQPCSKPLPNCNHICPVMCHTAVKVRRKDTKPRAGPWEGGPLVWEEIVNRPCPPCQIPIPVQCFGKHEISSIPCAFVRPYSCQKECGRLLPCGNHICTLPCHVVEGATDDKKAGKNCASCELPCGFDRPEGCEHQCLLPCHSDACPPCKQMIRMRCHCQVTVQHIPCCEWVSMGEQGRGKLKSCGGTCPKTLPCGHTCGQICHPGNCLPSNRCEKKVTVRCKCKRKKKDAVCKDVQTGVAKLECDDVCNTEKEKKKRKQEEEDKQRKEEEQRKQQAELEEFERKMKGRKRKPHKQRSAIEEETFFQKHKKLFAVSLSGVILSVFVWYIMQI